MIGLPVRPVLGAFLACLNGMDLELATLSQAAAAAPSVALKDATLSIYGDVDPTKSLAFQVDTQVAGAQLTIDVGAQTASRTLTVPVLVGNDTLCARAIDNTFSVGQSFSQGITATGSSAFTLGIVGKTASSATGISNYPVASLQNTDPTNNNGAALRFTAGDTGSVLRAAAQLAVQFTNKTASAVDGIFQFQNSSSGTLNTTVQIGTTGITSIFNTTAASSSITGGLIVGDGVTAGTNIGLGGGVAVIGTRLSIGAYSSSTLLNISGDMAANDGMRFNNTGTNSHTWLIGPNSGGGASFNFYDSTNSAIALTIANASGNLVTVAGTSGLSVTNGNILFDGGTGKSLRVTNAVANGAVAVTFGSVGPTGSTAGNPQGWLRISVAGTDRFIPFW